MWEHARELVDAAVGVPLDEVAGAMRLLAGARPRRRRGRRRARARAALRGDAGEGRVVCIVSGGNIDPAVLAKVLVGETP